MSADVNELDEVIGHAASSFTDQDWREIHNEALQDVGAGHRAVLIAISRAIVRKALERSRRQDGLY